MADPASPRALLLPAALDPARDPHGARFAAALPVRDGHSVTLPDLTYVFIVFTNRSGSTYLRELLATTGYFNRAGEPLNAEEAVPSCQARNINSFPQYFAAIAAEQQAHGHYVVKTSIGQLAVLAAYGILGRILPRSRFIVTERMDKLGQVISWQIAVQSGRFTSQHREQHRPPPQYDRALLLNDLAHTVEQHARIALFMGLNGLVPLLMTYEYLTSMPDLAGPLLLDFIGAPAPDCDPGLVGLRKQATALNDEWRARFLAGR